MREVGKSVLERELVVFDALPGGDISSLTKAIMLQHSFAKLDKICLKIHLIPQGDKFCV